MSNTNPRRLTSDNRRSLEDFGWTFRGMFAGFFGWMLVGVVIGICFCVRGVALGIAAAAFPVALLALCWWVGGSEGR